MLRGVVAKVELRREGLRASRSELPTEVLLRATGSVPESEYLRRADQSDNVERAEAPHPSSAVQREVLAKRHRLGTRGHGIVLWKSHGRLPPEARVSLRPSNLFRSRFDGSLAAGPLHDGKASNMRSLASS